MEPRPDGRGKVQIVCVRIRLLDAAMEPRPDGRGKPVIGLLSPVDQALPQWSPGLMAGGSPSVGVIHADHQRAAMEPRPDGRGKPPSPYRRCA